MADGPICHKPVEKKHQEKLGGACGVSGGYGDPLAVHLDRALPLLQVEPRPEEKPHDNRNREAPEVPVDRGFWRDLYMGRTRADDAWSLEDDDDRNGQENENRTVAPFDAADVKFFAEEDGCRESHQHGERQIKSFWAEVERLPRIADEGKNREGDREELVEEKDEAERA